MVGLVGILGFVLLVLAVVIIVYEDDLSIFALVLLTAFQIVGLCLLVMGILH